MFIEGFFVEKLDSNAASMRGAYERALRILTLRDHGTAELRKKLLRKGHSEEDVTEAIEKLEELGYLDDQRVARRAIESILRRRKGLIAAKSWLYRHGFGRELVEGLLSEEEYHLQERESCELACERLADNAKDLWKKLQRRGFRDRTIAKVLKEDAH